MRSHSGRWGSRPSDARAHSVSRYTWQEAVETGEDVCASAGG